MIWGFNCLISFTIENTVTTNNHTGLTVYVNEKIEAQSNKSYEVKSNVKDIVIPIMYLPFATFNINLITTTRPPL